MSSGVRRPYMLARGDGESVWSLGGRFTTKLGGEAAEGRFALVESVAFQTTEPPLHIHHRGDEAWYVIDGRMTFYVADQVMEATAGSFVFAPRGLPHTSLWTPNPRASWSSRPPPASNDSPLSSGSSPTRTRPPPGSPFPTRTSSALSLNGTASRWWDRHTEGANSVDESGCTAVYCHPRTRWTQPTAAGPATESNDGRTTPGLQAATPEPMAIVLSGAAYPTWPH